MLETLSAVLSIVIIDLVLSGDNAVVIGMAARRLSLENRRKAIIFGGAGAIGLRVLFTAMAAILLGIPYLQAIGGVLLIWIAYRLLRPQSHAAGVSEAGSLSEAIRTIVLADVVMSLDNILAVGGAAHGNISLLIFGLILSIPIILLGSEVVARLLGRFPILVYVGAIVLIQTAVSMVAEDDIVHDRIELPWFALLAITVVVSAVAIVLARRGRHASGSDELAPPTDPPPTDGRRPAPVAVGREAFAARESQPMNPNP